MAVKLHLDNCGFARYNIVEILFERINSGFSSVGRDIKHVRDSG